MIAATKLAQDRSRFIYLDHLFSEEHYAISEDRYRASDEEGIVTMCCEVVSAIEYSNRIIVSTGQSLEEFDKTLLIIDLVSISIKAWV